MGNSGQFYTTNPTMPKGRYKVASSSLYLVVEDGGASPRAYLVFRLLGEHRSYFSIPMEGIVQITPERVKAMEARARVIAYLRAAYAEGDTPITWMAHVETNSDHPSLVWRQDFWNGTMDDIDRDAVSGGYEAWVETLTDRS